MATLTSTKIKNTYDALLKSIDNDAIGTTAKQITDGLGNTTPLYVSTTQVGIGVTPESGLNLHVYGDAKIGSNLTIIGNLVVEGSTTTVGTDTLTVKDPLIVLANNNTSTDAVDIGFYGKYTPSGTTLYSGLFREALTGKYRLFKDLQVEPTTTVNTSGTGYTKADLVIGNLETTQIDLQDNQKIRIGVSQDLEIYHNATNSFIDNDTGSLYIRNNAIDESINIQCDANGSLANYITAEGLTGEVTLYHNGSTKLVTKSNGIAVTGIISNLTDPSAAQDAATKNYVDTQISANNELSEVLANGNTSGANDIIMEDSQKVNYGTGSDLQIYHDATDSYIKNDTGNLIIEQTTDDADIIFKNDNGSGDTIEYFRIDGSESRIVYGRSIHMADNVSIFLGNDDDGLIRYDSTANKILYTGTSEFSNDLTVVGDFTVDTSTLKVDSTNNQVGINNASPSGFTSDAKDLIIGDGTSNRGMTIYSSSLAYGHLFFQDAESSNSQNGGFISYNHNGDGFEIGVGGAGLGAGSLSIGSTSIFTRKKLIVDSTFGTDNTLTVEPSTARVGIYNDSPSYRLDVSGDARFTGQAIVNSDLVVDTDTLFVDASEDSVGIGLTNPADYTADELVISVPDESGMTLVSGTTDAAYISFADATGTDSLINYIRYDHNDDTMSINNFGGSIKFSTGEAVNRMTINTGGVTVDDNLIVDGNVGINETSPASSRFTNSSSRILDISGNAVNRGGVITLRTSDDSKEAFLANDAGLLQIGTYTNNDVTLYTNNIERMRIDSSGTTTIKTDGTTQLILNRADSSIFAGNTIGTIQATADDPSAGQVGGQIQFTGADTWSTNYYPTNIIFSNDNSGTLTERMRIDGSGNSTFAGNVSTGNLTVTNTTSGWTAYINNNVGSGTQSGLLLDAGSSSSDFAMYVRNAAGSSDLFSIKGNGNVGIGTTNPTRNLTLGDGSGNSVLAIVAATNGLSQIGLGDTDDDNYGQIILRHSDGLLQIQNGGGGGISERGLNITSSENVGIGTTSPNTILEIASGNSGGNAALDAPVFRINNTTASADWDVGDVVGSIEYYTSDTSGNAPYVTSFIKSVNETGNGTLPSGAMVFGTATYNAVGGAVERMRIDSSGNVGIGTTEPAQLLQINGAVYATLGLYSDHSYSGNRNWRFITNGFGAGAWGGLALRTSTGPGLAPDTTRFGIDYLGNVGIGTTSPDARLHVVTDEQRVTTFESSNSDGPYTAYYLGSTPLGFIGNAQGLANAGSTNMCIRGQSQLVFSISNTERMRIDSSGAVLIGTTSSAPSAQLTIALDDSVGGRLALSNLRTALYDGDEFGRLSFVSNDETQTGDRARISALCRNTGAATDLAFYTGNTSASVSERMRITSSGDFIFNTGSASTQTYPTQGSNQVHASGSTYFSIGHITGSSSGNLYVGFAYDGGAIGSITQNGTTGVAYNTSSDYRLKENVVEMTGALDRVSQLKPSRFNFIGDADKTVDGFLAHEVQEIVPEAITGEKDGMRTEEYEVTPAVLDEEGNITEEAVMGTREVPEYQGIDQSKLVPLLVGAIQELKAEIELLKTKINN